MRIQNENLLHLKDSTYLRMVLIVRVHTQQLALDWEGEVPAPAQLARQDFFINCHKNLAGKILFLQIVTKTCQAALP